MTLLVLFSYLLSFFTRYNLRSDDLNIYIPYIQKIVDGARLGSQYDTQLYYWVLGLYTKMFYRFFGDLNILPIGLIVVSTSLVLFIMIWFTFHFIRKWMKENQIENGWLYLLVITYTLFQFWYIVYPSYGNTFRRLSVVWVLLTLSYYIKKPNTKLLILLSFELLALINFSSTGLFLNIFLLYALAHLFAYRREEDLWKKFWMLSLPLSLWLSLFNPWFILVVGPFHLLLLGALLSKNLEKLDELWIQYHSYILILVPTLFSLLAYFFPSIFASYKPWITFFTNPEYEMLIHYLRWDFSTLKYTLSSLTNLIFWGSLILSLIRIPKLQNQPIQGVLYIIFVVILTFFNPFVARFVISNFTLLAYFRIYDILFNPFSLLLYFTVILSIPQKNTAKILTKTFLLLSLVMGIYTSDVWPYLDFSGNIDPIHHVSKDQIEVFNQLETYIYQEKIEQPINIIAQIHGAHLLTELELNRQSSQRIDNVEALFSKTDDASKINQIFMIKDSNERLYMPPYNETCQLTESINTQFIIVEAQFNWDVEHELGYCAEKIFEVSNYRVFRMRYDWLD